MSSIVVVGANWGDEGKGRIVDYLAGQAGASIRFRGGNNAGHTVVNDLGTFKLHQSRAASSTRTAWSCWAPAW